MLLKDCLLTKERGKQKKKKTEKVFVPFWYLIFTLHQLKRGKKNVILCDRFVLLS